MNDIRCELTRNKRHGQGKWFLIILNIPYLVSVLLIGRVTLKVMLSYAVLTATKLTHSSLSVFTLDYFVIIALTDRTRLHFWSEIVRSPI